jgi:tagatose-6-phosphate ketose/aldose isomerase
MVIPAQLIGFYKSLQLGLQPDAPSASGAISRVVEGVKIYPFENLSSHNGSEHPPK